MADFVNEAELISARVVHAEAKGEPMKVVPLRP